MHAKSLDIKLDKSPLPSTEAGVQEAFETVVSGHAHGKVMVTMVND